MYSAGGTGAAIKRRGILAAAGTIVAGLAMKEAAQPVAAATFLTLSNNDDATNVGSAPTTLYGTGFSGPVFRARAKGVGLTAIKAEGIDSATGLSVAGGAGYGYGTPGGVGMIVAGGETILGEGFIGLGAHGVVATGGKSANGGNGLIATGGDSWSAPGLKAGHGVVGTGGNGASGGDGVVGVGGSGVYGGTGVYGSSDGKFGVFGSNTGTLPAVYGYTSNSTSGAVGTQGYASAGTGVLGNSATGIGVRGVGTYGVVGSVPNVANSVAVNASNTSTVGTANYGVFGSCDNGYGVYGVANRSGFSGCTGGAFVAGTAAFAGGANVAGATAAYFSGPTIVEGDFTVVGGAKNAAVRHPDGSYRLLHCVESPEPWFEDFGEGTLTSGKAEVRLDADFAAVIEASTMHAFAMPHDGAGALRTVKQTAAGFAVEEIGGVSGGAFSWRVVAKRKDLGKVQRLAKFTVPNIRIPGINGEPLPPAPPSLPPDAPRPEKPRDAAPVPAPAPPSRTTPATVAPPAPPAPAAAATAVPRAPTGQPTPLPLPPSRP